MISCERLHSLSHQPPTGHLAICIVVSANMTTWNPLPPRHTSLIVLYFTSLSHPVSLLHFPIHFHLFPFISIVHFHFLLSFTFSMHSPVSDSSAHVSGLLSVLQVPYISRVLVLDRSGLITCIVSLLRRFALATISYRAPSVITCSLLPCSGLVRPSPFHMYLLPFTSGCHFSFTI